MNPSFLKSGAAAVIVVAIMSASAQAQGGPQGPQMRGDGGLGDPELRLDDGAHRAGGHLTIGEQLEDPPTYRVAEHIKGVH